MAEVGLAVLSVSLQVLFERLASPDVVDFIMGKKLDPKLVQRLKRTLNVVGALVNDAENKQVEDVHVNNWLDDLKDAVYEADDLLDELSTKAATQSQKKVRNFPCFLNFQVRDNNLGNKIADIIERLEDLAKHKDTLGLKHVVGERFSWRPQSTSSLPSDMYGRDEDKKAIINLLLSDDMSHGKIGVIPIVGMGGIGKTTLAQLVYNDEKVRQKFDLFAWTCVSEEFDVFNITKTVIENITSKPCEKKDLDSLQLDLKKKLKGKKFLFVLDDVWNESPTRWDPLMTSFYQGSEGSKLIVTTRSETVVRAASVIQRVHHLNFLSKEDCWLIFTKLASPLENSHLDSYLEKNKGDIINKCKGLPLAAKLLGGLFQSKPNVEEWDIILKNNICDLSKSKTLPALRISYHYLPPHLKRCFVHCSLFPKDYEFSKDELILLWMAEDLLQPMEGNMTLEEVGNEYFKDLLSRSFLQPSSNQSLECFVIHDLIHDLATFFAGKFYNISKIGEEKNITEETRHLSYITFSDPNEYNDFIHPTEIKFSEFKILSRTKALRTFLPLKWSYSNSSVFVENVQMLLKMLLNLKCMRALSVCKFQKLGILPKSICELIHLQYLDLSFTNIKKLPTSLCKLHNLQTLKLQSCYKLTVLPNNIQDLVNLRFLDVSYTPLQKMPRGMRKLKNLCYLSDFIISKDQGAKIEELGDLPNIGNHIRIRSLEYVSSGEEAYSAKILDKKGIESIELIWTSNDHMPDSITERDIIDKLQSHSNLRCLLIRGYRGTRWPDWLGLQDMTKITLQDCNNCYSLPPLGQIPSLKSLKIRGLDKMVSIEPEFYNSNKSASTTPFPSLKYLSFSRMPAWQEWCLFETDAFPQLQELSLDDCSKLVGYLPKHLPALEILYIDRCQQLATCITRARLFKRIKICKGGGLVLQAEEGAISVNNIQIYYCKKLEFPNQVSGESLKSLEIGKSCDSLCFFPIDAFPNLEELTLWECENLESIVSQSVLQNVQSSTIEDNPNLVSLSRGLPTLNMTRLVVTGCPNFKSLPCQMDKLLPKLKSLQITGCPETEWHGEGNMPPHLTHLTIDQCIFAKFSKKWHLPNLTNLVIDGNYDNVQCFPAQGLLLSSSITTLWLENFQNLETFDCNGFLHLTSLEELIISYCPKLEKITGQRLPSSVERLKIIQCPLLEEQCRMKNAEIWPKISHIPAISYDWR